MDEKPELITVFRSMDSTAEEDCEDIIEMLKAEGLTPSRCDDTMPGVPEGTFGVCVPVQQVRRAELIISENPPPGEVEEVDPSSNLDLETIYHAEGNTMAEVEAMGIKQVLNAGGIAAVIVGDQVLPSMPFQVKVARENVDRAKQMLADAERAGPAAAEEAELAGERRDRER